MAVFRPFSQFKEIPYRSFFLKVKKYFFLFSNMTLPRYITHNILINNNKHETFTTLHHVTSRYKLSHQNRYLF